MRITETEHVIVRTLYPGQALRVSLVQHGDTYEDLGAVPFDEANLVAELVIAPNHRLLVESGGVKVEFIKDPDA